MSYNGSGTFVINTAGQPVVSGTVISSTAFNALTADLANGLSTAITKDGQTTPTANIPMGNNKITALANGTAATDAANLGQVQSTTAKLINSISGADTITGTLSPTLTSYAAGQMFYFVAAGDNTGAVTLNINSLGAKSVTRDGAVALAASDIKSGEVVVVVYDGTQFQVVSQLNSSGDARFANVSIASALNVGGVSTLTGAVNIAGAVSIASSMSVVGVFTATGGSTLNGGVVINEPGADVDFRVESDTDTHCLFVDASANNVGIGTASPAAKLDVRGGAVFANYGGTGTAFFATDGVSSEFDVAIATNLTTIKNNGGAASLAFATAGSERLRIDASGNLGLGVTPQTWTYRSFSVGATGSALWREGSDFGLSQNAYYNSGWKYAATGGAALYDLANNTHVWYTAPSGTAGNAITFTQAMTLDASGDLTLPGTLKLGNGVQTIAAANTNDLQLNAANGSGNILFRAAGAERARITSGGNLGVGTTSPNSLGFGRAIEVSEGTSSALTITSGSNNFSLAVSSSENALRFYSGSTERARITSGGELLVGLTSSAVGEYLSVQASNSSWMSRVANTNASPRGEQIIFTGASPNGTANWFLYCEDSTAQRASIRSNGGLANYQSNNVDLSDARTKKDITPAASMWDKIGALEIVTYKYNDQTHDDVNVGVIAQQVESVEPVWVDADGFGETLEGEEPLKTVYTKDITFAAIKALQEAMSRIEALEAKVAALEGK